MGKIVYVVTSGIYSDHHVEAVCSTRAKAETVKARLEDEPGIEEWELDEHVQPPEMKNWNIVMDKDGNTKLVRILEGLPSGFAFYLRGEEIAGTCWARDEKHAVKIANEFRTRSKAQGDQNAT